MNAQQYLEHLEKKIYSFNPSLEPSIDQAQSIYSKLRSDQIWDHEKDESPLIDLKNLNHLDIYDNQGKINITKLFQKQVYKPLLAKIPIEISSKVSEVTVGVLPTRVVNAHALLAPNNDSLIIIDQGLLMMGSYFIESLITSGNIMQTYGLEVGQIYLDKSYKFIIDYFISEGNLNFPLPYKKIKKIELQAIYKMAYEMETFVLAHELAHIYAGHLNPSTVKPKHILQNFTETVNVYEQSYEQEFLADELAWKWYHDAGYSPIIPLYFFCLVALVEKNISNSNRFYTHPTAIERINRIINKSIPEDNKFYNMAIMLVNTAKTFPDFNKFSDGLLLQLEEFSINEVVEELDNLYQGVVCDLLPEEEKSIGISQIIYNIAKLITTSFIQNNAPEESITQMNILFQEVTRAHKLLNEYIGSTKSDSHETRINNVNNFYKYFNMSIQYMSNLYKECSESIDFPDNENIQSLFNTLENDLLKS